MHLIKQNKNLFISFSSILVFVLLLFIAYSTTGLAGATISEHMVLPLSRPFLCMLSIALGAIAGIFRKRMLFRLPLSFCFGITVGILLQPKMDAGLLVQMFLAVAVASWLVSLLLAMKAYDVSVSALVLLVGMGQGFLLPLSENAMQYSFFAIYGVCLMVMLLIACGICVAISLTGISLKVDMKEFEMMLPKQPAGIFSFFL